MCVSYYHYCQLVHDMKATFEEFADLFLNDKAPVGPVFNHYLGFWRKRHEFNIMFIRYEDMKHDLKGMIRKTAKFLEKPITEDQVDELAEHLSFSKMKNNPAVNLKPIMDVKNGKDFFERTGKCFIRKGQNGDWKNFMTPELSKKFDDWTELNLKETGLCFDS